MKKLLQIALGIIAAIGGYVDIGDLVFNTQAGAIFGYKLLWAIPVGLLGIMVFAEMSGRVAAIGKQANFELVRDRFPRRLAAALISSLVLKFLTLAAELGGIGLALTLLFDGPEQTFMFIGALVMLGRLWFLSFDSIERIFGYGGLRCSSSSRPPCIRPRLAPVGQGFVPESPDSTLYWYFAVGLIAAAFMPYEIYFYSSGARRRAGPRRTSASTGPTRSSATGSAGCSPSRCWSPRPRSSIRPGVDPSHLATVTLGAQSAFGETGLIIAVLGVLFALGGAAIDTASRLRTTLPSSRAGSGARRPAAPRWDLTWMACLLGGYLIVSTGVDPIELTEYAVVLSVIALPLTYLPILLVAKTGRSWASTPTAGSPASSAGPTSR